MLLHKKTIHKWFEGIFSKSPKSSPSPSVTTLSSEGGPTLVSSPTSTGSVSSSNEEEPIINPNLLLPVYRIQTYKWYYRFEETSTFQRCSPEDENTLLCAYKDGSNYCMLQNNAKVCFTADKKSQKKKPCKRGSFLALSTQRQRLCSQSHSAPSVPTVSSNTEEPRELQFGKHIYMDKAPPKWYYETSSGDRRSFSEKDQAALETVPDNQTSAVVTPDCGRYEVVFFDNFLDKEQEHCGYMEIPFLSVDECYPGPYGDCTYSEDFLQPNRRNSI